MDSKFKAMLAGKAPPADQLQYPLFASPKLDGLRFHIFDGKVHSRNLLPFKNHSIHKLLDWKKFYGLDGELMCGDPTDPKAFRKAAVANSHFGDISEVRFHVFDDFSDPKIPFKDRLVAASARCIGHSVLRYVSHNTIYDAEQLIDYEQKMLEAGYEGIMIRDPFGPYKYGRSTPREGWLLKVKQFDDSEAVIDGAEELMHNANDKTLLRVGKAVRNSRAEGKVPMNTLGALVVRDTHTGIDFRIGTGFDDVLRSQLWEEHRKGTLSGKVVKYKFFPSGGKTRPRFPVFLGFRDLADL